jgi:hypothetical protein
MQWCPYPTDHRQNALDCLWLGHRIAQHRLRCHGSTGSVSEIKFFLGSI